MCKQAVVLDTIKKTKGKGGMTSAQIKLAEAQSEDYAEMKRELQELKTDVNDVKKEFVNVKVQLAEIKGTIDTVLDTMKENGQTKAKLLENKYFWIFITVALCLFAGVTHIADIAKFFGG